MKRTKRILLGVCVLSMLFSINVLASSKSFSVYNSSRTVFANANVNYSSWAYGKNFLGYGACVGGQDSQYVTEDNPGSLTVSGNSSGVEVSKKFWTTQPLNSNKLISNNNTTLTAIVKLEGCSTKVTIK